MRSVFKAAIILPLFLLSNCEEKPAAPGPDTYAFNVTFTPEAEAKLIDSYTLGVDATYFGVAKPEWRAQASLGRYQVAFERAGFARDARRLRMNGPVFDKEKLTHIDGPVNVLINVRAFDGRGLQDRTVHCKAHVAPLETVKANGPTIACGIATP